MSTYYRPTEPIPLQDIINSDYLKEYAFEVIEDAKGTYFFCEGSYIHYATDNHNNVIDLFRYGRNNPDNVLDPLMHEFGIDFVSEHDEEYDDYCHPNTAVITINFEDLLKLKEKN
tara:strand:+ start:698 stop:1042 length:345 start_codon:yes stop_codon:yes gene_type:complete